MKNKKINVIDQIEEIMGDLSSEHLIDLGYIRLNSCDVGLDIRAGTVFLDQDNEALIVLGSTKNIEYYGGFEYIEEAHTMKIQMGNQKITVYLSEADRVQTCFDHYTNVYLPDLEASEEEAKNSIWKIF